MIVVPHNSGRIVKTPTALKFRDEKVVFGNNFISKSGFANQYRTYEVVTDKLTAGDYKFGIKSVDNLDNVSSISQGIVTVAAFRMFPRFINIQKLNDPRRALLTWTEPVDGTPDTYKIYSNNGDSTFTFTLHSTLSGTVKSLNVTMNINGTWAFKVEAVKSGVESSNSFVATVEVPYDIANPPAVIDLTKQITSVNAKNSNAGKIEFSFLWIYGDTASKFRLYHDRGSGNIYWNSFIEFSRIGGYYQKFTTPQIYFGEEDKEFKFVVRAVSKYGVEDTNTEEHTVLLDGVAPDAPSDLTLNTRM